MSEQQEVQTEVNPLRELAFSAEFDFSEQKQPIFLQERRCEQVKVMDDHTELFFRLPNIWERIYISKDDVYKIIELELTILGGSGIYFDIDRDYLEMMKKNLKTSKFIEPFKHFVDTSKISRFAYTESNVVIKAIDRDVKLFYVNKRIIPPHGDNICDIPFVQLKKLIKYETDVRLNSKYGPFLGLYLVSDTDLSELKFSVGSLGMEKLIFYPEKMCKNLFRIDAQEIYDRTHRSLEKFECEDHEYVKFTIYVAYGNVLYMEKDGTLLRYYAC